MVNIYSPVPDRADDTPGDSNNAKVGFQGIWVIIGFTFWVGIYLGAVIMQSVTK